MELQDLDRPFACLVIQTSNSLKLLATFFMAGAVSAAIFWPTPVEPVKETTRTLEEKGGEKGGERSKLCKK